MELWAGLVPPEACLLGVQMAVFFPVPTRSSLPVSVSSPLFLSGHRSGWIRAHPNDLILTESPLLRPYHQVSPRWGLRLKHSNLWGAPFGP